MFGLNNNQKQINDSLKPINKQLETHYAILEDYIKYKAGCEDRHRRTEDKLNMLVENQSTVMKNQATVCSDIREIKEFCAEHGENLRTISDVVVTGKTGKKSLPWIVSFIGIITLIISGVVIGVEYIQTTIATLLK